MKNKKLIVKHNKLIEANYKLTLQEQKLILVLAAAIKRDDREFRHCVFSVDELAKILKLNKRAYYSELKNVTEKLLSKVVIIMEDDGPLQISWLSSAKYYDNLGRVELSFSEKLRPYLLQLSRHFTKLECKQLVSLNSVYSIRIYELCKQYEKIKRREIKLDSLKEILQVNDKKSYKRYNNFKRKVLLQAKEEINEKTDLIIDFEEIKTGRKVTAIKFLIDKKKDYNEKVALTTEDMNDKPKKVKNYSKEVLELFELLPKKEQTEAYKGEFERLLGKHSLEYLKADIEYAKRVKPANLLGFLKSSCNQGHYAAIELEKKRHKEELARKRAEEAKRRKEREERLGRIAHQKAVERYERLSEEELKQL